MKENDYYHEIKNLIENYEINHRVRTLQDNSLSTDSFSK